MTRHAILNDRGMLPEIRSSGFGMALKTLQVDVLSIYQFIGNGSMGIVAIRTFDLPFPNRMMGLSLHLSPYPFMAWGTNLGLGGFCEILGMTSMNTVTVCAGEVSGFVFAAVPHSHLTFGVTIKTGSALFFGGFR